MTGATGSTGVPTDRSTMPPGCARAVAVTSARVSQGKTGSRADTRVRGSVLTLRRQSLDGGGIVVGLAHLGCATGRAQLVEEIRVGLRVAAPVVGHVVFVEDGLDRADGFAGAAIHALVGVD